MQLEWKSTYRQGGLVDLDGVDLATITANGVYVIYSPGDQRQALKVIYVGQGDVSARLASHREDKRIITAKAMYGGALKVTFAAVPAANLDGVECYLARRLAPLVGERHPACPEVLVNLPFAA